MKKPNADLCRRADNFIKVLRAFKQGKVIQYKGIYSDEEWEDQDLAEKIGKRAAQYRVKPL